MILRKALEDERRFKICMVGGGFGPSTGRIVEVCESSETRLATQTRSIPPVMGILVVLIVFLGVIFGTVLVYDGSALEGGILFVVAVIAISCYVFDWRMRCKEA